MGYAGPLDDATVRGRSSSAWRVFQWVTTGCFGAFGSNRSSQHCRFSPSAAQPLELLVFLGTVVAGLGFIFARGGEKIQQVVDEKSGVVDVRAATVIDLLYAVILYIFKIVSQIPMSTTWVFVGLLAGRELALAMVRNESEGRTLKEAARLVGRDFLYVAIGFAISLVIAAISNPVVRDAMMN